MKFPDVTAHRMVAEVATALAQEVYEELASHYNGFYAANPDRATFVRHCAPTLRAEAREALAMTLADPDLSPALKDRIHEAIVLDRSLPTDGTSIIHKSQQ